MRRVRESRPPLDKGLVSYADGKPPKRSDPESVRMGCVIFIGVAVLVSILLQLIIIMLVLRLPYYG